MLSGIENHQENLTLSLKELQALLPHFCAAILNLDPGKRISLDFTKASGGNGADITFIKLKCDSEKVLQSLLEPTE